MRLVRLSLLLAALCLAALPARAQGRVALMIGNAAYAEDRLALRNPVNDAEALGALLTELGFAVTTLRDGRRGAMRAALDRFAAAAQGAEIAVVFYAGHGVQVDGRNLLIGTGLAELTMDAARDASITLSDITDALDAAGPQSAIVIIDACRDNPLAETGAAQAGLAPPRRRAGTLIAYATDPGNVAFDGTGRNSTFTESLLRHFATPGLDVRIMLGRVRQEVVRVTGGRQVPWVEDSLLGEIRIRPGEGAPPPRDEIAAWRAAQQADRRESYRGYLAEYPDGLFAAIAQDRIAELAGRAPTPQAGPVTLAADDIAPAAAALELAGLLTARGLRAAEDPEVVGRAFARWAARRPSAATLEDLFDEGAQRAVFLGTYSAGILRKDLQSFLAVEQTLDLAERDMAAARADFGDDPAAQPVLAEMQADLAETRAIRDAFARRLDDSRSYYHELITTARTHFADRMSLDLVPRHATTRASVVVPSRAVEDAEAFLRQVDILTRAPSGSYLWLADFLEGSP